MKNGIVSSKRVEASEEESGVRVEVARQEKRQGVGA
jgi:hypothetical protein